MFISFRLYSEKKKKKWKLLILQQLDDSIINFQLVNRNDIVKYNIWFVDMKITSNI